MVEPGLFRHYKGNFYRVLFLARHDAGRVLEPDEEVLVFAVQEEGLLYFSPAKELEAQAKTVGGAVCDLEILRAKNSTDGKPAPGSTYVVYVSLYPSSGGRVSVRELSEFEGFNDAGARRFEHVLPNCHACAHSGMGPEDLYLVCGHPDAGVMGTFIKKEPLDHCPNFSKFEQHPHRNPDGTLIRGDLDSFRGVFEKDKR